MENEVEISVSDLRFYYGKTKALKNISMDIYRNRVTAIIGPSGCGKSTLLNILGLLDNPTEGRYFFDNQQAGHLKERQRTQMRKGNIGFVFQSFNLIDELNVFENVELPLIYLKIPTRKRKEMVQTVLKRMNIGHREKHFPQEIYWK